MKIKFFVLTLLLCLSVCVLCACGVSEPVPTETPSAPTATEPDAEPTDKGIFIPESVDPLLTLPEDIQDNLLPEDEFGDDVTGIFESHPITEPEETDPNETEEPTEAPTPTVWDPDVLPEDVFED